MENNKQIHFPTVALFCLWLFVCLFVCAQGLESCLKGPDSYNSQTLIEATVISLTKLQPLLNKVLAQP